MPLKARNLTLTHSQAACLIALRRCKDSKTKIAIEAKLDLIKTATALGALARLGLAKRNRVNKWHATARGKTCRYDTVPDRLRRNRAVPGAGGQRLLALLDRPMRGREIAEKLGATHQRVRQLVIKLHAQGHVSFCDQVNAFWLVMRAGDKTRFLSRDEERVLSAIPREYVTDAIKIRLAAHVRFPWLFVVNALLSAPESEIAESGVFQTRRGYPINSVSPLQIAHQSINALMQYLKRKHLVEKTGQDLPCAIFIDGNGACGISGNDTTTSCIMSTLLGTPCSLGRTQTRPQSKPVSGW